MLNKLILILLFCFTTSYTYAINFDGADDVLLLSDADDTELDTLNWTVIALIRTDVFNAELGIYAARNSSFQGKAFALRPNASGSSKLGCSAIESTWAESTGTISDNDYHWVGVTATRDSASVSTCRFFIDGSFDSSDTTEEFDLYTTSTSSVIGAVCGSGCTSYLNYFDGNIEVIYFWNEALTDREVIDIMNSNMITMPLQKSYDNLGFAFFFNDAAEGESLDGVTIIDRSQAGNNFAGVDGANNSGLTSEGKKVVTQ
jgi:hypothetical protein